MTFESKFIYVEFFLLQMDEERDEAERLRRQIDRLKAELERERVCCLLHVTKTTAFFQITQDLDRYKTV